jgi:hypothetical protein
LVGDTYVYLETAHWGLEPVCNLTETTPHQSFPIIYRRGFSDPGLLNAIMLALSFAANDCQIDRESLAYKTNAISYINQQIGGALDGCVASTIGAILLIVGVEVSSHSASHGLC